MAPGRGRAEDRGRDALAVASRGPNRHACSSRTDAIRKRPRGCFRKLVKKQMQLPRVMITDKLGSYGAAKRQFMPGVEHGRCRRTKKVVDPAQLFPTKPLIAALLPDLSGSANAYIR